MKTTDGSFGLPALVFKYDTIYLLMLGLVLACACSIAYCLILFSIASNINKNLGIYLNMVTDDGFLLALLIAMPGLIVVVVDVVVILCVIYTMYDKRSKNKNLNFALFALCLLCAVSAILAFGFSVVALSHSHSKHEKLHDGIRDAMDNYALDSTIKRKMDLMQIMFQCCGSKKYTEWYEIRWFDGNFIDNR